MIKILNKEVIDINLINIPTSSDIYIEVNGKKLAVAQSYTAKSTKESKYIEAFGSVEPVGTVQGRQRHTLELSRLVFLQADDEETDFYKLSDFNVVIVGKVGKIIYSGCQWTDISQGVELGGSVVEKVRLVATKRLQI